jgi:peptidase A4-like protein
VGGTLKLAVAAAMLSLAIAAPAASASTRAATTSTPTCGPGGPYYVNGKCISANWSGLLAIGNGSYTVVQAYWKQPSTPALFGHLYEATSIWVGLGGGRQGEPAPAQVGTIMTTGFFGLTPSLKPDYSAFYETPSTGGAVGISGFNVHPGDTMAALVAYVHGAFHIYLTDVTTGQRWSSGAIRGNFAYDTAEAIVEAPAYDNGKRFYDLAPFGSVKFYNLGIGGVYALQMVRGNTTLASTSLPSVVITYHHSS